MHPDDPHNAPSQTDPGSPGISRRAAIAGLAGAAGLAAISAAAAASSSSTSTTAASPSGSRTAASSARMPVVFLPHGGGPWPWMKSPFGSKAELGALTDYLRSLQALPKTPPRAILAVSAHWEEPVPTVMTSTKPPMLYDYYGFPPETYQIQWSAPGAPDVAARVQELLGAAGFKSATDARRGFDHGTFVPLKLTYPNADVPTIQLSLVEGLDPAEHIALGRALAPLRDEGVFIVGSGMTYHNLRGFGPAAAPVAAAFDRWLVESATLPSAERDARLAAWTSAPAARSAHPREEHLIPLMVCAGAAGEDRAVVGYSGTILGLQLSAYHFG